MTTYVDAYHEARRYKNAGATRAVLERLAARYDSEGKHGAAKAVRKVAGE